MFQNDGEYMGVKVLSDKWFIINNIVRPAVGGAPLFTPLK